MALSKQYEKQADKTQNRWRKAGEKSVLGDEAEDKIGNYDEAAGGGTPIKAGEKFTLVDNPEEADAIRAKEKNLPDSQKSNIRVMQPRNPDGTFGYNSQNRRGLRYKSRGTTIPDFLKEYVAIWYREGKTDSDLITSQDEEYLLAFDMTMEELIERSKYYLQKEDMFSFLAGKGDIIQSKHNDDSDKTQEEIDRDMKVAKSKRDQIMAQREKENPDNLSFQEGKGMNSKKIGPKFARPVQQPQPTAPVNKPQPTQPVNNAAKGGFSHNGKTYDDKYMQQSLQKINASRKGAPMNMAQFKAAIKKGIIKKF